MQRFVASLFSSTSLNILEEEVDFLVDTGAVRTTIMDRDAKRLGIDYKKLRKYKHKMTGIGGSVDTYVIDDSALMFFTDKKERYKENIEIMVLKHPKLDEKIERLPSILGRDIIGKYNLIYSKPASKVYLTDEEIN
ncbi:MAG: retroviral-like aspartic protease family protein [Thaumarchaeota archaeon]|nr:retroviral-like aspartic protease family protein [Nitrososphaerota archaeon]